MSLVGPTRTSRDVRFSAAVEGTAASIETRRTPSGQFTAMNFFFRSLPNHCPAATKPLKSLTGELDYLGPLLGFMGNELAELGG